jgi:hypothetical protein
MKDFNNSRRKTGVAATVDALRRAPSCHRHSTKPNIDKEAGLQLFVLQDAVRRVVFCRRSPCGVKWIEMSETMAWVNIRGCHDQFSFDSICQLFEIEPGMLRRQLNSISRNFFLDPPFSQEIDHVEGSNFRVSGCHDGSPRVAALPGGESGHGS